jgi:hypothetical protein
MLSSANAAGKVTQTESISYLNSRTDSIRCDKFKDPIKKNCVLTTLILKGSYQEYCLNTDCDTATIDDMLAWLKQKETILSKIKETNSSDKQ